MQRTDGAYTGYRITFILISELAPEGLEERTPFGLASGEEPAGDADPSSAAFEQAYDRYEGAVGEALQREFPGAQVLVRHSGESLMDNRFAIVVRGGEELASDDPEYRAIVRRVLRISDRIAIDTGDWLPTGCTPDEIDRILEA